MIYAAWDTAAFLATLCIVLENHDCFFVTVLLASVATAGSFVLIYALPSVATGLLLTGVVIAGAFFTGNAALLSLAVNKDKEINATRIDFLLMMYKFWLLKINSFIEYNNSIITHVFVYFCTHSFA